MLAKEWGANRLLQINVKALVYVAVALREESMDEEKPFMTAHRKVLSHNDLCGLDVLHFPVWIFDIELQTMWWANVEAIRLWNSSSLDALLARDWSEGMSDTTQTRLNGYLERFRRNEVIDEQWTFYPKEGEPVTVQCMCSGVQIDGGRMAMLIAGRPAKTEEIQPEGLRGIEALRHTSVIISLYDMQGDLLFQNPSATRTFGGASSFQSHFVAPEEAESVWKVVLEEGYHTGKHRFHTKDGIVWHGIDCTRTVDPVTASTAILVNQRNIQNEWWSESILDWNAKVLDQIATDKPLKALLQTIVEMTEATEPEMLCSILLLDETGKHLYCVAAPSLPDFFCDAIDGAEIGPTIGSCGASAYLGEMVIVEDIQTHPNWAAYKDLAERAGVQACWSVPIKDIKGKVLGTFAAYYSTPRSPTKEHLNLLEMAGNLVELAIKRHDEKQELVMARQRAENANMAKSEFLSTMSHELRTPLTSSLGSLGLLSSLEGDALGEERNELVEIALRNNKTLLRLVNELLDYEKILSGTLIIETSTHDICALVSDIIKDLQGYAQAQSVNFILKEHPSPIFVDLQEYRFGQILNNLLSNAAKFSKPGTDVLISIQRREGYVCVNVKDSGPGIPEKFREKIYEQFTQLDSSSTRKHSGTGLGLAISKALTEGMAGNLDFETELGQGSTFSVCFPESIKGQK